MRKIMIKIILLTFAVATAGLGCKGLSQEEQAAVKPVTLNYWTVYNDLGELSKLAAEYQKIRPYVTIKIRQVRYDEFDNLFTNALADDVGPDVVSMHARWLARYQDRLLPMPAKVKVSNIYVRGKYAKETVVEAVSQAMPSLSGIERNYVSAVTKDAIIDKQVYGLPLAMDVLALYYNRDLLDKAGIPEPPKTWDEFMEAVKKTTKFNQNGDIIQSGAALGTGANIENAFDILSLLMLQNGVNMAQGNRVLFNYGLDKNKEKHPALEALRFYTDFAQPTKEVYTWNDKLGDARNGFVQGRSAFYFGFAHERATIMARGAKMNIKLISIPQLNESQPANTANYWLESVVKKSRHPDEAWDFVRFIASEAKVKEYTEAVKQPSPYRSQIAAQVTDPAYEPFVARILNASNWYHGKDIDAAKTAFNDLIAKYLEPYGGDERPAERDANLLNRAAKVIEQTY